MVIITHIVILLSWYAQDLDLKLFCSHNLLILYVICLMKSKFIISDLSSLLCSTCFSQVKIFLDFSILPYPNPSVILLVLLSKYIQNVNCFSSLHCYHHGQATILFHQILAIDSLPSYLCPLGYSPQFCSKPSNSFPLTQSPSCGILVQHHP